MTKPIKLPYKMLIYDIENNKMRFRKFATGEQYVGHSDIVHGYETQKIICIAAKWYGEKEVFCFTGETAIAELDKMIDEADVVLGKNNVRFDDKHVNTHRMLQKGKPKPQIRAITDDLESQLRKYFKLPSYSLEYISTLLGFGGKDKMEGSDWDNIQDLDDLNRYCVFIKPALVYNFCFEMFGKDKDKIIKDGEKSLARMIKYNKIDVIRTEQVLTRVLPYIQLKKKANVNDKDTSGKGCTTCGSLKLIPEKIITAGQTRYQEFYCSEHEGYGGRATIRYDKNRHKVFSKIT